MQTKTAVVVGFNRLGGVRRVAELLRQRDYRNIVIALNAPEQFPELRHEQGVHVVRIGHPFSSDELLETVRNLDGFESESPFLCLTDRPMFAYLDALSRLRATSYERWVPADGIRNARLKPRARQLWDAREIDGPKWRVVSSDSIRERQWKACSNLIACDTAHYVIKPIQGAGSECVTAVEGWSNALAAADVVRQRLLGESLQPIHVGDEVYFPSTDILIEEEVLGPEYTIDGFVSRGKVEAVVQHKESRKHEPFFGDGLIVSPPDPAGDLIDPWDGYRVERHSGLKEEDFIAVVERGLAALGLDNWGFHAEMIVADGKPQFVELNPRPAGGLLWQTAGLRLGLDPFDACVRFHLGEMVTATRAECVTGQFPIYADRLGEITHVAGIDDAKGVTHVHEIRSALPTEGIFVDSLDREHYLAFVSVRASNHAQVRKASSLVREKLTIE
jgi:hypothetical protein